MNTTNTKGYLLLLFFITLTLSGITAQEVGEPVKIKMKNGNTYYGMLSSVNDSTIVIQHEDFGEQALSHDDIQSISPAIKQKEGTYWHSNPNPYAYLVTPSGYNLKKGEAYYQNTLVFIQSVHFGITDHISISGGAEIATLIFENSNTPLFFIAPKVTFPVSKSVNLGATFMYIRDNGLFDTGGNILYFGTATFGNRSSNLSIGLGSSVKSTDIAATLSGMLRISSNLALVTENWIIPNTDHGSSPMVFSVGCRFIGEIISVDIAFAFTPPDDGGRVPWLNFTYPF